MITDMKDITSFKWATVTGVDPLAIRLDGDSSPLALIPDSIIDPLELIVGDRVRVELSLRKCVIHGASNGGGQSGEVKMIAVAAAPKGWLLCQGQSLLRSQYPRLFAAIGTTYGAADSTHFTLPDMRGRVVVGRDATQTEFDVLGEVGGAKNRTLTDEHMPMSTVQYQSGSTFYAPIQSGNTAQYRSKLHASPAVTQTALPTMDPYIVLNFIIKI